jgi:hypothetical protein
MGLDMYAFTTTLDTPPTDFEHPTDDCVELFYWRKHPDLHGWMRELYFKRGGEHNNFNCSAVRLEPDHLDELEKDIRGGRLPKTAGFFFGTSRAEEKGNDLEFVRLAREAHKAGKRIYYTSWW